MPQERTIGSPPGDSLPPPGVLPGAAVVTGTCVLVPAQRRPRPTRSVVHVTGVTVTYVWCHGDPYVFPAGFAEQEHVLVRPFRKRRFEHPIPEYDQQAAVL